LLLEITKINIVAMFMKGQEMHTKLILFVVFFAMFFLGFALVPLTNAEELPLCHKSGSCSTECERDPNPSYDGYSKCHQVYPQANRDPCGSGYAYTSKNCGKVWWGEGCNTTGGVWCGSYAYSSGACRPN
jgi:hypothetical protein